jgi:hypothetical protein
MEYWFWSSYWNRPAHNFFLYLLFFRILINCFIFDIWKNQCLPLI